MSEKVSVIIPAYNEATYIGRLLDGLAKQACKSFEVIVSDAQSKDGTDKIVKSYSKKLDIKFIESPPKGPSAGRNIGAKTASGTWFLFLDADDDIQDKDFIKILIAKTKEQGWNTSCAKLKAINPSLRERIGFGINYRYIQLLARTKHPVAPGWCILTRAEIFRKHKGFNEKIRFGEDYDYVSRSSRGKFGFVEDTYLLIDLRRAREEGLSLTIKAVKNEIYRHTHRYSLEHNPYKYEFGKHKKLKSEN